MQIVIDIPEEEYMAMQRIMDTGCGNSAMKRIIEGVPLSSHGRLIDADELLAKMKRTDRYFMIKYDVIEMPTMLEASLDYKMVHYSCGEE